MTPPNFQITEENLKTFLIWKAIIKDSKCKIKPSERDEHEECPEEGCPGNYYNGRECNWGGNHSLDTDLEQINNNFACLDELAISHHQLGEIGEEEFTGKKAALLTIAGQVRQSCDKPVNFFKKTCLTEDSGPLYLNKDFTKRLKELEERLDKYIDQITALTYEQVTEFADWLNKLQGVQTEYQEKRKKWKEADNNLSEIKKLEKEWRKLKEDQKTITKELNKHPALVLFDNTGQILTNSKKELVAPTSTDPFAGLGKSIGKVSWIINGENDEEQEEEKKDEEEEIVDEKDENKGWPWGTIALYGGGGLVIVVGLVLFYKWSKGKVS